MKRSNQRPYRQSQRGRRRSSVPFVIIVVLLLAGIAFGIAWAWQAAADSKKAPEPESSMSQVSSENPSPETSPFSQGALASNPKETNDNSDSSESGNTASKDNPEASDNSEDKESATSSGEESSLTSQNYTRREAFATALTQSENPVGDDYFKDALFLGDSISTGIPLYLQTVLSDVPVIAEKGIGPHNALTREIFPVGGVDKTMLEAAKAAENSAGEFGKIYILLGGNTLGIEKDYFLSSYKEFLQAVKEKFPNATIYVQSMTPVTATVTNTYPNLGTGDINAKINEYNLGLMQLASEAGVYYLDIASVFVDSEGRLPNEASPSDGMHFGPDYYFKWYEYLKNHTAK